MTRGSTLIYHLIKETLAPGRTFTPLLPPGLPANDPDSLMGKPALLFPFNTIYSFFYFIIPLFFCQERKIDISLDVCLIM